MNKKISNVWWNNMVKDISPLYCFLQYL